MIQIDIPKEVQYVLDKLKQHDEEAYIVGGAVRDSIMHRQVHDWDICTSAEPNKVMDIFKNENVIETGLQHGTVTIVIDKLPIEVTTFRIDGNYSDNRRPDNVVFTKDITEDLLRRDFTINAIAYNPDEGLIDPYGGYEDINLQILTCVGNSEDRLNEDPLRILRALRFSAQLEFSISQSTRLAILGQYTKLEKISMERINSEFCKIVKTSNFPNFVFKYFDVFALIIPELKDMKDFNQNNPYHDYDVLSHTMHALSYCLDNDLITKLAIFFHDVGKPHSYQDGEDGYRHFKGHGKVSADITDKIMRRMKFDNDTRSKVVELVFYHDSTFQVGKKHVKRWLNKLGEEQFLRLLNVRRADVKGQKAIYDSSRIDKINIIEEEVKEVLEENECFTLKDLAINGNDLIQLGYKPGKELGKVLSNLLSNVINNTVKNDKNELLNLALMWYHK